MWNQTAFMKQLHFFHETSWFISFFYQISRFHKYVSLLFSVKMGCFWRINEVLETQFDIFSFTCDNPHLQKGWEWWSLFLWSVLRETGETMVTFLRFFGSKMKLAVVWWVKVAKIMKPSRFCREKNETDGRGETQKSHHCFASFT